MSYKYESFGLEECIVSFLDDNPGSYRRDIDAAMTEHGFERYATDKVLKRMKKRMQIRREGETMNARWFNA